MSTITEKALKLENKTLSLEIKRLEDSIFFMSEENQNFADFLADEGYDLEQIEVIGKFGYQ